MKIIAGRSPSNPDPCVSGCSLPATVATELLTQERLALYKVSFVWRALMCRGLNVHIGSP